MFISNKKHIYFIWGLFVCLQTFIQLLFYFIQFSVLDSTTKGIEGILRNESGANVSYYITKSIKDLEHMKMQECSVVLSYEMLMIPYLDLRFNKKCDSSFFLLNGINSTKDFVSQNGDRWSVSFKTLNSPLFYYALWSVRIFTVLFLLLLYKLYVEKIEKRIALSNIKSAYAEEIKKISKQVSHDIRSPLAALGMAIKDTDQLPESSRIIIRMSVQRIQDIANNLLSKTSSSFLSLNDDKNLQNKLSKTLLYSSLDEILTEKRMQFRSSFGIHIEGDFSKGFGVFSIIENTSFKRVISNLINNAIEALPDNKGRVLLSLEKMDDKAVIKICDNGKGIPEDILMKLGQEGLSFGKDSLKESGSGLGLYHALSTIMAWNGNLKLDSQLGIGTNVTIILPLSSPPDWFMPKITLKDKDTIVILDDDQEIHHTWDIKFKKSLNHNSIIFVHLSTPDEVRSYFLTCRNKEKTLFLSDFELIGFKETGLDLIKELELSSISVLVTSHYMEEEIQFSCKELGIKILPKMMASNIDIEYEQIKLQDSFNDKSKHHYNKEKFLDALYIEDDKYLRLGWEKAAQKNNIAFLAIDCPERFSEVQAKIKPDLTKIYIDQNFDNSEIKGLVFAEILYKQGYKNLFLASGYFADDLDLPDWIISVGKDCPWG